MPDKLRCAVIGTGAIGMDHLNSLSLCRRAALVAIAENNPQRAKAAADHYHLTRSYTDYREVLEQPDIDAVTIAVPNNLHCQVAIQALQARKHVMLEKPMAMNAKEAARIVETAKKMKRTLMVGQHFRFNRHVQLTRQLISRGELGEVYHGRGFWLRRSGIPRIGSWFTQKNLSGGGCLLDIGVHFLDAALHLMNEFDAVGVSGQTYSKFGPRGVGETNYGKSEIAAGRPFDVEDYSLALIKLKSGRTVLIESSWAANLPGDAAEFGVDLLGTNAGMSLFPARLFRHGPQGYETIHWGETKLPYPEDRLHHFVDCVLDGRKTLIPMEESLKVQKILDAIYLSSQTGKEVRLKP